MININYRFQKMCDGKFFGKILYALFTEFRKFHKYLSISLSIYLSSYLCLRIYKRIFPLLGYSLHFVT